MISTRPLSLSHGVYVAEISIRGRHVPRLHPTSENNMTTINLETID